MAASFPFFGLVSSMGVISFVAIPLRGKYQPQVLAGALFRCPGFCLKLLKLLTLTASEIVFNCTMTKHIFRTRNRLGKCRRERPRSCQNNPRPSRFSLPHSRGARAYIVSARDRPDLIAYWEEIPVQHECSRIADVDGGQLCHPSEACPAEAVPAGTD